MHDQDLTALDACALSQALHQREVSAREVMQAYLQRIDALNPQVNALVGLLPHDGLLQQADERDAMLAQGRSLGWMHGFPMAIKELSAVAGLPLSMGSPLLAGQIAYAASMRSAARNPWKLASPAAAANRGPASSARFEIEVRAGCVTAPSRSSQPISE